MILHIDEYKMLMKWFRDSKKYCTKMMSKYKYQNREEYMYWKGQRKAFRRSLYEIKFRLKG